MSNDLSYNNIRLLSLCAVLRLFDPELLRSLAEAPQDDIDSLLASDLVVLVDDSGSAYHLRADIQTDVLVRRSVCIQRLYVLQIHAIHIICNAYRSTKAMWLFACRITTMVKQS